MSADEVEVSADGRDVDVLVVRDLDVEPVVCCDVDVCSGVVRERVMVEDVGSSLCGVSSVRSQSGVESKSKSESRTESRPPLRMSLRSEKSGIW